MTLRPTFEHYYPEGFKGGECGIFAHNLVTFQPVGNSIQEKRAAVVKSGFNSHFQVGDVLIFDVGNATGHVAVINTDLGNMWQLTESNWNLDGKVHHTRMIPKTLSIVGGFRGALKLQIITNPLNLKVKIINNHRSDALNSVEVADIISTAKQWSNGSLNLVLDGIDTNIPIKYGVVGSAGADSENPNGLANVTAPDFVWFHDNVAPFACGYDAAILQVEDGDWQGNVNGVEHLNPGFLPALISCHEQDLTEALNFSTTGHYNATQLGLHEIRHALCAIAGLNDDTHAFLTSGKLADSFLPANLDYDAIERNLVTLRANQPLVQGSIYPVQRNFSVEQFTGFGAEAQAAILANPAAKNQIVNGFVGKPW